MSPRIHVVNQQWFFIHPDSTGSPVQVRLREPFMQVFILEHFRAAFRGFDFEKVTRFNKSSVERLLRDSGIVRHRGKIESVINNAKRAIELVDEFGSLAAFFWSFEPESSFRGLVPTTPESEALSKELKRRGWSFVGPTTAYAFMQAMGLVNDHIPGCAAREEVASARESFTVPASRQP